MLLFMKRLGLIIYFYFIVSNNLFSQTYIAEYLHESDKCFLTFNSTAWRYDVTFTPELEIITDNSELNKKIISNNSIVTFNYRSLEKNEYLDTEYIMGSTKRYIIMGELEKQEWTIFNDSIKSIENLTCLMAKGSVRGRNYTVWFTPDIPVSAGPWKLWGLPGLIVDASSDDGVVKQISIVSLIKTDSLPEEPVVTETVTHNEFKTIFHETVNKFKRTVMSFKVSDTAEISVSMSFDHLPDKSLYE